MPSADRMIVEHDGRIGELERWRGRHAPHELGPTLGEFYATYLGLPGLRGLWYPGSADNTGAVYDRSGQTRTLTYNGNPAIRLNAITNPPILIPHYDLDGTGDFFSRADEAGLEISGAETYIAGDTRGLTMGGWFLADDLSAGTPGIMSKWTGAGNQRAYLLRLLSATRALEGRITTDGITNVTVTSSSGAVSDDTWYFFAMRFQPSQELAVFINDTKAANVTAIPATIFNTGTAAFQIGAYDAGTNLLTGRWALAFLCAAWLPDFFMKYLYRRGNVLFGL